MTRNQNNDNASSMKRIKTCDSWSDLSHDVLILVMMQLGVIDFLSFSEVCKSWRLLALSSRNKFMASITPIPISMSTDANEKNYYLKDIEGRKFKTTLPHSTGRTCVGFTCDYLILFGKKSKDFWLVNPITMHELHFPDVPFVDVYSRKSFRAILVFSASISDLVFVMTMRFPYKIWFSVAGKRKWMYVSTPFYILDLLAFKGKIYTLHYGDCLCEVRLFPTPKVTLLEFNNFRKPLLDYPLLLSSGENLYVMDRFSKHPYKIQEINFSKMEWVTREKIGEEYAFFFSYSDYGATIIQAELWTDRYPRYDRYALRDKSGKGRLFQAEMWYFFHDCLIVDLLHE